MSHHADRNFIIQQGLPEPTPAACPVVASALLFQPRIVLALAWLGVLLQAPGLFLGLGAVLACSAALPRCNPFDALHNATLARRPGVPRLGVAAAPRRFAQLLAGILCLAIARLLVTGHLVGAQLAELTLLGLGIALAFGRFCLGSLLWHLLTGRALLGWQTLPWRVPAGADPTRAP